MPRGHVARFSGVGFETCDAVEEEPGWEAARGTLAGLLAHAAGSRDEGSLVTERWESGGAWSTFIAAALQRVVEKVRGLSPPDVTTVEGHASFPL